MNKHQAQYLLKHSSFLQKEAVNPAGIGKGLSKGWKSLSKLFGYGDDAAKQVTQKGLWPNDAARSAAAQNAAWRKRPALQEPGYRMTPQDGRKLQEGLLAPEEIMKRHFKTPSAQSERELARELLRPSNAARATADWAALRRESNWAALRRDAGLAALWGGVTVPPVARGAYELGIWPFGDDKE